MRKNSVKAFTILEMLINIAIMSIIIGMVYYAYSSFAKQVSYYQSGVIEQNELDSFCLQLKTDFFNAEKIVGSTDSFEVFFYNTKSIKYEIKNGFLLRKQNQNVDSLRIRKVNVTTISNPDMNEILVQKAIITTYLFDEPIEYMVTKKYPTILKYIDADGDRYK